MGCRGCYIVFATAWSSGICTVPSQVSRKVKEYWTLPSGQAIEFHERRPDNHEMISGMRETKIADWGIKDKDTFIHFS